MSFRSVVHIFALVASILLLMVFAAQAYRVHWAISVLRANGGKVSIGDNGEDPHSNAATALTETITAISSGVEYIEWPKPLGTQDNSAELLRATIVLRPRDYITISSRPLDWHSLNSLSEGTRCSGYSFANCHFKSPPLEFFQHNQNLRMVSLHGATCEESLVRGADLVKQLSSLDISRCNLTFDEIASLSSCLSLRTVYLRDSNVTGSGKVVVTPRIVTVDITGAAGRFDEWIINSRIKIVVVGCSEAKLWRELSMGEKRFKLIVRD